MTIDSTASLGPTTAPNARAGNDPRKIHESSQQFESLLIGEMLKASRSDGGWLGTGDDDAGGTAVEMAEQQLAQAMAATGGLGLGPMIERGLTRDASRGQNPRPGPARSAPGSGG